MKSTIVCLLLLFFGLKLSAQKKDSAIYIQDPKKEVWLVETACGQCKLGLKGKGCDLAIRTKGKAYFVDGTDIDSHGDAHADDGFCNAIRKAYVQGTFVNNRFKATYFQLVDSTHKKPVQQ